MTKREFLNALLPQLRKTLPADEVVGAMEYYEECINDRMEDGLSEEEAVQSLGSIDDILRSEESENNSPRVENQQQAAGEFHAITIDAISLDVRIQNNPGKAGTVETVHGNRSNVDVQVQNGVLTVREDPRKRNGSIFSVSIFASRSDVVIYVSDQKPLTAIRASTVSGDVGIDGVWVEGSVELKSVSGDIDLRNAQISGDIIAASRSGDWDIRRVRGTGDLHITSTSGDIDVEDVAGIRTVSLNTKSGDLELRDLIAGNVSAKTISGDIDLHYLSAELTTLNTTSGDIEGKIADDSQGYTTQFSSVSGTVSSESAVGGAKRIVANTVSGDIELHF